MIIITDNDEHLFFQPVISEYLRNVIIINHCSTVRRSRSVLTHCISITKLNTFEFPNNENPPYGIIRLLFVYAYGVN